MNTYASTTKAMTANELAVQIFAHFPELPNKSAWDRGVKAYAGDILAMFGNLPTELQEWTAKSFNKALLNGADSWHDYSYGGSSLIHDYDIAKRLCSPSVLKKKRGGELNPNEKELWLDVQARALTQAALHLLSIARRYKYVHCGE